MKFIDGPTGRELTGDEIPYHLRDNVPPLGRCDACGRTTWAPEVGEACKMPSPTGKVCRGTFRSIALDPALVCDGAGVTDPTLRDSLRGGSGIAPAAHPTPSGRRDDITAFIVFAERDMSVRLRDRSNVAMTDWDIHSLINRYLAEWPRSS